MVFESIVADLLNRFVGEYVENLDKTQLKIGIWGGDVVLNDLIIKESVLRELDLPISVAYARLGKLVLKIPWKEIYSAPAEAVVERLFILAVPNNSATYNAEKAEKADAQAKRDQILRYEKSKELQQVKENQKLDKSFSERLIAQIINNVQIKITDIHIRYEDSLTAGNPFALGVTLKNLSVHTTDENWIECLVSGTVSKIFKVAKLEGFAVYFNSNTDLIRKGNESPTEANYSLQFKETIASSEYQPAGYDYIFGPISSMAKLTLNPNPELDENPYAIPKIKLNMKIEKLALGITRLQYQDLMQLVENFGRMVRGIPYRKFRPNGLPYRGHYRDWWHFAYTCILETEVKRKKKNWSWENMITYRQCIKEYANVYKNKLTAKKVSPELVKQCEDCELKLDMANIIIIRQQVELEIEKLGKLKQEEKGGWFSGWFSSKPKSSAEDEAADIKRKFEAAMTPEEKAKLYEAIGYQENASPQEYPEHYVGMSIEFVLEALEISVRNEVPNKSISEEVLFLQLGGLYCILDQRPATSGIRAELKMNKFQIDGVKLPSFRPTLVSNNFESEQPLLDAVIETNPIDKSCDQRVKVSSRPLQVIYDAETIIQLLNVFSTPKTTTISQLQDAAADKLANIKERSATGLQYAISKHPRLELDIEFMPSYIVIPKNGVYHRQQQQQDSVIVISLGKLLVQTEPRAKVDTNIRLMHEAGAKQQEIMAEIISQSYDKFFFEICEVQAFVANPNEDWLSVIAYNQETDLHLLQPTSLKISCHLCVIDDDPRLPKMRLTGELSSISVRFSESRVMEAISILLSIPLPKSEEVEPAPLSKENTKFGSNMSLLKYLDDKQKTMNRTKTAITDPSETEQVQFTMMEINFVLNEFCVIVCRDKTSEGCSSDVFATPTGEFPTTPTSNEVSPQAVALRGSSITSSQSQILSCKIKQLEIGLTQKTYELKLGLKLGAISVNQYRRKNNEETIIDVLSTPMYDNGADYLFTINYLGCKRSAPEFNTKYGAVEQLVELKFSTMLILLHQEGINEVIEFTNELQNRISNLMLANQPSKTEIASASEDRPIGASLISTAKEKLPVIMEDEGAQVVEPTTVVVDSIKVKVVAKLEDISVELQNEQRSIAVLEVKNLQAGVIMKTSYTDVNLRLQDIVVTDRNESSVHPKILSIIGENAISCQVILFNLSATSEYNSDNMKIDVTMGCAKIVFLNLFVSSVLNFLDNFQTAQQRIKEASAAAAEAAKSNVVEAYAQSTRVKLNVKIKAPIVIIPIDSKTLKGIAVDLGHLTVSNFYVTINSKHEHGPALIDDMKVELSNMKLSRVLMTTSEDTKTPLTSSTDVDIGMEPVTEILLPTSFTLNIKRNLSASWFKEQPDLEVTGKIPVIELRVESDDYKVLMQILSKNMTEVDVPPKPQALTSSTPPGTIKTTADIPAVPKKSVVRRESTLTQEDTTTIQAKYVFLKFSFQLDSIKINLFSSGNNGLATFELYYLSVRGQKLNDGCLTTSVVLCDIHLDDKRPNRENKITRFMKKREVENELDENQTKSMVDVTLTIKDNNTFVDLKVYSFSLILSLDFLLKISNFFQMDDPDASNKQKQPAVKPKVQSYTSTVAEIEEEIAESHFTLNLQIEQPDIILVEDLNNPDCYALILNNEVTLKLRNTGLKNSIKGEIKNFCLYLSKFQPDVRTSVKNYVIHPCVISLNGSTLDDEGLHLSLMTSNIKISVSPSIIQLINSALTTLTSKDAQDEELIVEEVNHTQLWQERPFKEEDFWFMYVEEPEEALSADLPAIKKVVSEVCIVQVPSVTLIVETGVGVHTIPMLALELNVESQVKNWSSAMQIEGCLQLGMSYYNNKLAIWEPFVEPIDKEKLNVEVEYQLWDLNFDLKVEGGEETGDSESTTKIAVSSSNPLELTVTKTCLDMVTTLSKAFSEAIKPTGISSAETDAPYVVKNDTGETIMLDLKASGFLLHPASLLSSTTRTDSGSDVDVFILEPDSSAYLQPKMSQELDLSFNVSQSRMNKTPDKYLHIQIGNIGKSLAIPVYKADYRYFPLYRESQHEAWAIISEVKINLNVINITIRGIVQVYNHFTAPISMFFINNGEYQFIGEVPPNDSFNIPLKIIYAPKKEIYFSLFGYKPSAQGMSWKENAGTHNLSKNLQCDPVTTYEPFFITAIREREEAFHEVTSKYTMMSASYTIHLRPPLSLRNSLPIPIRICVLGCSVPKEKPVSETSINSSNTASTKAGEDFLDYGEKLVNPGEILHLPTVKTSSKTKDIQTYIVVKLNQYLEKDWSCTTEITTQTNEYVIWTFNSYDSFEVMSLQLGVRYENLNGGLTLTLYCPFWFINKTGLALSYRSSDDDKNILYHPAKFDQPVLFSFREKAFFGKKKATIRVNNGDWCEKFSLDVAGSSGVVLCKASGHTYQIAIHNILTNNSLTKQIVFMPFFTIINRAPYTIEVQDTDGDADKWLKVISNDCSPFWPKSEQKKTIQARYEGTSEVTEAFKYSDVQTTLLKLNNKYGGINADVHVTESAVYITFADYYDGDAPALIVNEMSVPMTYWEKGNVNKRVLNPKSKILYTWSDPCGERTLCWNNGKNVAENDLRRDGIDQFKCKSLDDEKAFWVSFLDGTQRILLFTQDPGIASATQATSKFDKFSQEILVDIQAIGINLVNNNNPQKDIMYVGVASSGIIWEEQKKSKFIAIKSPDSALIERKYQDHLNDLVAGIDGIGYSINESTIIDFQNMTMKRDKKEAIPVRRIFYPGVWLQIRSSPYQLQLHAKINRIQIDNQLTDCIYPVVLAPVPPPKSVAANIEVKPFVEMSVVQRIIPHSNIKQFKYLRVLMQEFHVKVDLIFINEIFGMLTSEVTEEESKKLFQEDLQLYSQPLLTHASVQSQKAQKNFYDNLHLGPLKIHVSFSMAGSENSALPGVLSTILQGVGVTLTDINDVVFKLSYFEREYQFLTQPQLVSECTQHYTNQALKQLYVLVLGLDVIGNPYGLFMGFTKGVEDFFYEPIQGAVQGPGEFAEGLVLGVKSLFGHTVGGAAGAVSKITGAVGKGIAALTFDKEYQKKRRDALNRKPANLQEGIARSGKGLVMGVFDGVTGVFTKPISGARSEGFEGFFKGLGKGAVGLVARPTAGVIDFASGSFDAVKRATELSNETNRLRPPRFLHSDNIMRPYSRREAEGSKLLREVDKGKFAISDTFVHMEVAMDLKDPEARLVILLTNHRALYCNWNGLFGGWQSEWSQRWSTVSEVKTIDHGIDIYLKTEKEKKTFKFFGSSNVEKKTVYLKNPQRNVYLGETMQKLILNYNESS